MLKGQHYGTPADVFSFAIVMSEVVTLSPPYDDMLTGESGASLPQIVEMTKPPTNVRPTVGVRCDCDSACFHRSCLRKYRLDAAALTNLGLRVHSCQQSSTITCKV